VRGAIGRTPFKLDRTSFANDSLSSHNQGNSLIFDSLAIAAARSSSNSESARWAFAQTVKLEGLSHGTQDGHGPLIDPRPERLALGWRGLT
jgi:hypothetical protein